MLNQKRYTPPIIIAILGFIIANLTILNNELLIGVILSNMATMLLVVDTSTNGLLMIKRTDLVYTILINHYLVFSILILISYKSLVCY